MGRSWRISALAFACAACNVISADDFTSGADDPVAPPPRETTDGFGDAGDDGSGGGGGGHGDHAPAGTAPSDSGAGSGGDAASGADAGLVATSTFFDDFARPDGTTIGNGWIPKIDKWSLSGGLVLEAANTASYKDLLVHRPSTEAALDVEVSVDATLPSNGGDVSLYARVQPGSDASGTLTSYTFYPGDYGVAYLDHDVGSGNAVGISSMGLSPPLVGGQTIHLTLRVTGTSPPHLYASITTTSGQVLGSLSVDDTTPNPIVTPGVVGFGSGGGGSKFDNFRALTY